MKPRIVRPASPRLPPSMLAVLEQLAAAGDRVLVRLYSAVSANDCGQRPRAGGGNVSVDISGATGSSVFASRARRLDPISSAPAAPTAPASIACTGC